MVFSYTIGLQPALATSENFLWKFCSRGFANLSEWPNGILGNTPITHAAVRGGMIALVKKDKPNAVELWLGHSVNDRTRFSEVLENGDAAVESLQFHPNNPILATTDASGTTRLWWHRKLNSRSASVIVPTYEHEKGVANKSAGFSPQGTYLWLQDQNGNLSLRRINLKSTHQEQEIKTDIIIRNEPATISTFLKDSETTVLPNLEHILDPTGSVHPPETNPAWSAKENIIAQAHGNQLFRWRHIGKKSDFESKPPIELWRLDDHHPVADISTSVDGKVIAVTREDGMLVITKGNKIQGHILLPFLPVATEVSWHPAYPDLMAVMDTENKVYIFSWQDAIRNQWIAPLFQFEIGRHHLEPPVFGARPGLL